MDLLDLIRQGRAHCGWKALHAHYNGHVLEFTVMRDALKFDGVPPLSHNRTPLPSGQTYDGVRLPATSREMQEVADLLGCCLPTPKILDMVWDAADVQFDAVVNVKRRIVASSNIHDVHEAVEAEVQKAGGDTGGIVASVGKYWVLTNKVASGKFGKRQAVNYGWYSSQAPTRSVTGNAKVWQGMGSRHDSSHRDPSQVIRLVYRLARLMRSGSSDWEDVDVCHVLADPALAPLISHEGALKVTRMLDVPEPKPVTQADGSLLFPEMVVLGE